VRKILVMWKFKVLILSIISLSVVANQINENIKLGHDDKSAADEPLTYRLPNNTVPKSYEISIETKIHENNFEFNGNVKILVEIVEPTDTITLHYRQIEIDNINIYLPNEFPLVLGSIFDLVESHDFLIIKLPRVYNESTELLLDISYLGNLRDDMAGFYHNSYLNNGITKWFAATHFQMDYARHAMPCFDEPGFRATMQLTLRHGSAYNAISNTEVVEKIPDGDYVITKFAETPVMPTYLLAFVVSEFEYVTVNGSRIPQKIYGRPEKSQYGELEFAAGVVGRILDIYETLLTVDYPLNKMDHVAVQYPRKYSMENFGLIVYDENAIALDPSMSENYKQLYIDFIMNRIFNSYSLQWFGNTVSPKWWQHLWLSEGFAIFFEGYLQYLYYDDRSLMDKYFTSIIRDALISERWTDISMNDYVEHPHQLWSKFNIVTTSKSACILRMFMEVMTEDVFIKGLIYYLKDNFMQSVTPAELHKSLQQAYDEANAGIQLNIGAIMDTWENQAGNPLISVSVSGSNLVISQKRHYLNNGETYSVPLTFATKSNPIFTTRTKTWLPLRSITILQASLGFTAGDWIIFNINQVGYYRVDYDTTLWHAIIDQFKNDHTVINPINRQVLHDEFFIAWNELYRVSGADALSLLSYLHKESNPSVWNSADEILSRLSSGLFGTEAYAEFLKMLQQITKPHLVRLGYDSRSNDTFDDVLLRRSTTIWNCYAIDGDCVSRDFIKLLTLYRFGLGDGDFNFCNAMKVTDRTTYSEILDSVITDRNLKFRNDYIWSLGCSIMPENLEKLLDAVLDNENVLENYEKEFILETMAMSSNLGLKMSINFIDEHYLELFEL